MRNTNKNASGIFMTSIHTGSSVLYKMGELLRLKTNSSLPMSLKHTLIALSLLQGSPYRSKRLQNKIDQEISVITN